MFLESVREIQLSGIIGLIPNYGLTHENHRN